jgi:hypothetical protein
VAHPEYPQPAVGYPVLMPVVVVVPVVPVRVSVTITFGF